MKLSSLTLAVCLIAGAAAAGGVAPQDVSFAEDGAVSASLSGVPGDPVAGARIMVERGKGNCIACHAVTKLREAPFHGEVGPTLDGAADRWEEAQLRGIVADSKKTFEDSVMPSFYKITGFVRPGKGYTGKAAEADPLAPLLSAQEIEDVVAFLLTLKE
ncbi:MAG: sulfur oxidation c-type cytochrome SoxX [Jhaorihella sp.]